MTSSEARGEELQPPEGSVEVGGWQRSNPKEESGLANPQGVSSQAITKEPRVSPASSGALDEQLDQDEGKAPSLLPFLVSTRSGKEHERVLLESHRKTAVVKCK